MATSNEEIRDALVRHQIGLLGLSAGMRNRIGALIVAVESDMRDEMVKRLARIKTGDAALTGPNLRRLRRLEKALREIQAPVWKEIRALVRSELLELSSMEADVAKRIIEGSLPVEFATVLPSADALRRVVTVDPMEGRPIRDWVREMEVNDRRRITQAIRLGLARGEDTRRITRRVFGTADTGGANGTRGITRRGAAMLTRTAVNHVSNQARQAYYLANRSLIPQELYVATLDSRTTFICMGLDGEIFEVGVGPTPPVHRACRSLRVPIIDGKILGTRPAIGDFAAELGELSPTRRRARVRAITGRVPASQSYNDFLRNQSFAFQREVLGTTRAKLFRDGNLAVDRFTDRAGSELTLAQLRQRETAAFEAAGL